MSERSASGSRAVPRGAAGRRIATDRERLGRLGEDAAAAWYLEAGFEVVDRNWRVREGELDLIVRRGGLLVMCEVKTRSSARFGSPIESIDRRRLARLRRLFGRWLAEHQPVAQRLRCDLAMVDQHGNVEVLEGGLDP